MRSGKDIGNRALRFNAPRLPLSAFNTGFREALQKKRQQPFEHVSPVEVFFALFHTLFSAAIGLSVRVNEV